MKAELASPVWLAFQMAIKDWMHEFGLSFCGVLALASMLAPLLILHGVHNGVITGMRENLMRDPAVLVIIPAGSQGAGFEEQFIDKLAEIPGVRYSMGRTRSVSAEVQFQSSAGKTLVTPLDATSPGDPVFDNYNTAIPVSTPEKLEISLTDPAARKLGVRPGDYIETSLGRRTDSGKAQRVKLKILVRSVLPPAAAGRDSGFVDMQTLQSIQDFRDGIPTPLFGEDGEHVTPEKRYFESFRVYAADLDAVEPVEKWFLENDIQVRTRSRDIANIKKIDSTLATVIGLIAAAGCVGFFAFMASTSQAATRRKWKQMGMMKLMGFSSAALWLFPITQVALTAFFGCLLAFCLYCGVAFTIDFLFAAETGGQAICVISPGFFILALFCVIVLAAFAALRAAAHAADIEAASAIRDSQE